MHRMGVTVGLQTLWGGAEKEQIRGRKPCGNPEVGATPRGMWGAGPGEVLCAADFAGPWMGWGHLWGACHDPPPGRSPHPGPPGLAHPSLPLLRGLRCGDAGQEEGGVSPKNWGRLVFRDSPCEGPQRGEQHVRGPRLGARGQRNGAQDPAYLQDRAWGAGEGGRLQGLRGSPVWARASPIGVRRGCAPKVGLRGGTRGSGIPLPRLLCAPGGGARGARWGPARPPGLAHLGHPAGEGARRGGTHVGARAAGPGRSRCTSRAVPASVPRNEPARR